jgi:hypothetical protein
LGSHPVAVVQYTFTHKQYREQHKLQQNNTNYNRTTQIKTNLEECGPCPVFASFTLEFALQLRKKHAKTSVRLRKTSVRVKKKPQLECMYDMIYLTAIG